MEHVGEGSQLGGSGWTGAKPWKAVVMVRVVVGVLGLFGVAWGLRRCLRWQDELDALGAITSSSSSSSNA